MNIRFTHGKLNIAIYISFEWICLVSCPNIYTYFTNIYFDVARWSKSAFLHWDCMTSTSAAVIWTVTAALILARKFSD